MHPIKAFKHYAVRGWLRHYQERLETLPGPVLATVLTGIARRCGASRRIALKEYASMRRKATLRP